MSVRNEQVTALLDELDGSLKEVYNHAWRLTMYSSAHDLRDSADKAVKVGKRLRCVLDVDKEDEKKVRKAKVS